MDRSRVARKAAAFRGELERCSQRGGVPLWVVGIRVNLGVAAGGVNRRGEGVRRLPRGVSGGLVLILGIPGSLGAATGGAAKR